MTRGRLWVLIAVLAVVAAGVVAVGLRAVPGPGPQTALSATVVGSGLTSCPQPSARPAAGRDGLPDLRFPCLAGDSELSLARPPRLPMVLNLWAPWCGPCRQELPLFQQLHEQAPDLVSVVGLVERDTLTSSLAFAAQTQLTFPSALDLTGQLLADQGLNALPVTYFIRADGSVAYTNIGPIPSYPALTQLVADHLGVAVPG